MLNGEYALNDLLRVIVDTMYRGMGFSQVLLCTRDTRTNQLRARFGMGSQTDALLKCFKVPLGHEKDVFQLALNKNADVFISNTQSDSVANRIPLWYRQNVSAQAFLLMPLAMNERIIGMFYAAHDQAGEHAIEPQLLQMLKTLRNQALNALSKIATAKAVPVNN
jgi:transcriptional regulator with GAF, ATPase, and Fis domain